MGFPYWTLLGMGVTAAAALVTLLLAYIAQSPRLLKRLGLSGSRLDLRARTLTGYALALLLLSFGFFIAGVPLGDRPEETAVAVAAATPIVDTDESGAMAGITRSAPSAAATPRPSQAETAQETVPSSGAFGGPPPAAQTATAAAIAGAGGEPEEELTPTVSPTPSPTATPTSTSTATPTSTPSPRPTTTPTPTLTPTPIFAETATINTGTSTLWIKRAPGGRDIALVRGGDIVLLLPGHANVGGSLWREVSTVEGTVGWVQESYLSQETEEESEAN